MPYQLYNDAIKNTRPDYAFGNNLLVVVQDSRHLVINIEMKRHEGELHV